MDISTLQKFIQLQTLSLLTQSTDNSSSSSTTGTTDFSSLLTQALTDESTTSNADQSLGLFSNLTSNSTSENNSNTMQLLASLLGNMSSTTQQNNGLGSVLSSSPTSMYSNYINTYNNNAAYTGTEAITGTTTSTTSSSNYDRIIAEAADTYGIPEKMIKAVIQQESNFNTKATNSSGAAGLMQLMPATAKSLGVTNVYDPQQNIMAGTKYLKQMLNQFGDYSTMLAAYNAGPGNVSKYNGIPPFTETKNYVNKIMNSYNA